MIPKVTINGFNRTESAAKATKAAAVKRKKGDKRLQTTGYTVDQLLRKVLATQKWTKARRLLGNLYEQGMAGDVKATQAYLNFITGPHMRKAREQMSHGPAMPPNLLVNVNVPQQNQLPARDVVADSYPAVFAPPLVVDAASTATTQPEPAP